MRKKYRIEVRNAEDIVIGIIYRVLISNPLGNFDFLTCRYLNKQYIVDAVEGDLSDYFRRQEDWNLYIRVHGV